MALLTTQQIGIGTAVTYGAVAASDTITADTGLVLVVKNASGTADTVTLVDPGTTPAGSTATNRTVSVPITTGERWIYLDSRLASASTGLITVTHSQTASVTCAVVRIA